MKRTPMRVAIPEDMREALGQDPFMRDCIINNPLCSGRIEWNHAFTYAGRRRNDPCAIVPMCHYHHVKEAQWRPRIEQIMRKRCAYFGLEEDARAKYPKADLFKSL